MRLSARRLLNETPWPTEPQAAPLVSHASAPAPRRASLGVIFLTLYIDLIGFSIIFPLIPDLLGHYLRTDGQSGLLASLLALSEAGARAIGHSHNFAEVLFGGIIGSLFSILQFIMAPIWGSLSDKIGRRPVLMWTVAGTSIGYLVWALSGSFWLFLLSRVLCGAFGGNLSVATAAVADITTREQRSKAMGLVGAAFGLGLVTGPMVGALTAHWNLAELVPSLSRFGLNPFSVPALLSFGLSMLNLLWIGARFRETLTPGQEAPASRHVTGNPLRAILGLENPAVRRTNLVAFVFSTAFVAMELTLTFLAVDRFHYTARQNGMLLGFLGLCSILTQGVLVRRLLAQMPETRVLRLGLACAAVGFLLLGLAQTPWMLYVALVFTALGSGLVNPSTTGLISLYSSQAEQGRILGIFRSLGSLSRAITPLIAGVLYWSFGGLALFVLAAFVTLAAWLLSRPLPQPEK